MLSAPILLNALPLPAEQQSVQSNDSRRISGVVKDEQGLPLPGVDIKVEGSSTGTISDMNGVYSIVLPAGKTTLEFSFIGYQSQKIAVAGKNRLNLQLTPEARKLDEVVVIGYGTQKAKDLTGTIESVSSKDFQKAPVVNAEELISNKISGVQVLPESGQPGAGSSILIRGGASLSASLDPLIVIDGMPLEGWDSGPGMLSQLNPNDIENFTVLKDASSAAIYGSRASNGVILITTKKGVKGAPKISFSENTEVSNLQKEISVLSAGQYRELINSSGLTTVTAVGNASTDWQKEIFQTALSSDYNLSVGGSLKALPYHVSVSYINQDGILKTGNYSRITGMLNLNPTFFNDHLKVTVSMKGSYEKQRIANQNAIWVAAEYDPTQPVYMSDQTYSGYNQYTQYASNPAVTLTNPLSMIEQVHSYSSTIRNTGNIQLDYKVHFFPDLHINVNAGYDASRATSSYWTPANYFADNVAGGYNNEADPASKVFNTVFESYANYVKELPSLLSKFDITGGYSYNNFLTTDYYYPTYNQAGTQLSQYGYPSTSGYAMDQPSHSIISFYGRLNYSFNQKYLLTASVRDDGSSRFAPRNRWGIFPSAALAWKMKDESFLTDSRIISDLKLRLSYGVTGQQDGLSNYMHVPVYTAASTLYQYTVGNTAYTTIWPSVYNPNVKWEQTATANAGIDYGFLEHRITGSVDVYNRKTKDLLQTVTVPLGYTFSSTMTENIGTMENKGVEFSIKAIPIQNKDFSWDFSYNFTYNQNKITHLNYTTDNGLSLSSDDRLVNTVGYSRNTYYLYHQVYDKNGLPVEGQVVDVNQDGVISASDRYITNKSSVPKYLMGFNTNFQYKKWTLGIAMHSDIGHYIYYQPTNSTIAITGWNTSENLSTLYYKTHFNQSSSYENYSDLYLQNASFLKLDNINLGYDFGRIIRNWNTTLRLSASVQNVFTITKFTGQDPETNSGYQNTYPIPRTFSLGLNLNF
jgi:iron complex outermembrane receptor protein